MQLLRILLRALSSVPVEPPQLRPHLEPSLIPLPTPDGVWLNYELTLSGSSNGRSLYRGYATSDRLSTLTLSVTDNQIVGSSQSIHGAFEIEISPTENSDLYQSKFTTVGGNTNIVESSVREETLIVDSLLDESDGDHSPGNFSLREAISVANSDSGFTTIEFSPALSGGTIALGGFLQLRSDMLINGLGSDQLTISGSDSNQIFATRRSADVEIRNLTLANGNATHILFPSGGAIHNFGNLTIVDTVVRDSVSTQKGGGIYNESSGTLEVINSLIANNQTTVDGGGIASDGELTIRNSTIDNNENTGEQSGGGGGIYADWRLTIIDSTVSNNRMLGIGTGGGIYTDGPLIIEGSTINDNSSATNGGGMLYVGFDASISNSTVSGNFAEGNGSGIAIFTRADFAIRHSTITGNFNQGIAVRGFPALTLGSTILSGNAMSNTGVNADLAQSGSTNFTSEGYNLIGRVTGSALTYDPSDIVGVTDPKLGELADNGGPTQTHAVFDSSPALNAGDPQAQAGVGNVPSEDQRGTGFPRIVDNTIDIGSFEGSVPAQPRVLRVDIGFTGDDTRSKVDDITVVIDSPVNTPETAFQIRNRESNDLVDFTISSFVNSFDQTWVRFRFLPGPSVDTASNGFHSLANGNYQLDIAAQQITLISNGVAMQNDYRFGDDANDNFFRFYGDEDGDRDVDGQNYARFGLTFLKRLGQSGYNSEFDHDGDNDVDGQDYARFGQQFLQTLPFV